jgi:fatty acid desaturase
MRSMSALRWLAIASNVAFIAYAYLRGLAPVLLLHTLLLPVNICRLAQMRGAHVQKDPTEERGQSGRQRPPFSNVCRVRL